jgi:Mlc titration factor MtfA (ptsG expression regulator)
VLHEFAHQLDMENGAMDGIPKLRSREEREAWSAAVGEAYERLARGDRRSVVDEYGAEDPSEFFAVVTESFFERPVALKREQPKLYEVLSRYYCVDPAAWNAPAASPARGAIVGAGRRGRRPKARRTT